MLKRKDSGGGVKNMSSSKIEKWGIKAGIAN
jgi:hypothetical protein